MGKHSKKHKKRDALLAGERHTSIKKHAPVSKILKKKKKEKLSAALQSNATEIFSPTFPKTSQEQTKLTKKKKKKRNSSNRVSEDFNNYLFKNLFDSVANENGVSESPTLTDTKSFFKSQALLPDECEIQYAKPYISHQSVRRRKISGKNEKRIFEQDLIEDIDELEDAVEVDGIDNDDDDVEDVYDVEDGADIDKAEDVYDDETEEVNGIEDDADVDNAECVEELDTEMDMEAENNTEDTFVERDDLQSYKLPKKKYVLEMKHQNNLYISGQLKVRTLFGSVEILGWRVNDTTDKSVSVFCPRGTSLLSLEPLEHSAEKLDQVLSELTALGMDSSLAANIVCGLDETSSLVLLERSDSTLVSYLGQHVPSISLYSRSVETSSRFLEIESTLNCEILPNGRGHCHEKSSDWEELADVIADDFLEKGRSRAVVCGGKGVGKSTLLRFLANRSLQAHGAVLYLDFDPGQSEFTAPGCVSVIRLTEPVLGPNYTHVRTPERSVYLGHVDMNKCPDRYIESVQHIVDYCQSDPKLSKMVWLVNTMGHARDLGVELNMTVIGLVQPSRVVQIVSASHRRNFPAPLLPENVLEGRGRWCPPPASLDFKLFQLQSMAETDGHSPWGLEAQITRNFLLLAYFHQMLEKSQKSLSDIVPYRTSLSRLSLAVLHETVPPSDVLCVMNAALVALCRVGPDVEVLTPDDSTLPRVIAKPPVCPCLGFGVVRGIDIQSRTVYVTTPLTPSQLAAVDCLAVGAVPLPPTLLLNANAAAGLVPYVVTGCGQITSRLVAAKFIGPRAGRQ